MNLHRLRQRNYLERRVARVVLGAVILAVAGLVSGAAAAINLVVGLVAG